MDFSRWGRALDALVGFMGAARGFRKPAAGYSDPGDSLTRSGAVGGVLGQLEARLAGVLVGALKQAFEHDRARLDLEQSHLEAERRRAEEALRLEIVRQTVDRESGHIRQLGGLAVAVWITSALLAVHFAGHLALASRITLGLGWLCLLGTLAAAASAWHALSRWAAAAPSGPPVPHASATHASWLFVAGLGLIAFSLILLL